MSREYRGFTLGRFDGVQVGHKLPGSRSLLQQIGHKTHRNIKGWRVLNAEHGVDVFRPTLAEARAYVDAFLGKEVSL